MPKLQRPVSKRNSDRRRGGRSRARWLAAPLALTLLGVAAYGNSFETPFVFDGINLIMRNPSAQELLPWRMQTGSNRPVGFWTFALNHAVGGFDVRGYHAVNLAIHVIAAWLLYGIVRRTLARPPLAERYSAVAAPLAFVAAAIWLVHPLETESVTFIYQRLEALMGLFYLLTLYCFVRAQDSKRPGLWLAASVIACALGMGSKEVMVTAPLIVLWYDRAFVASSWRELVEARWKYYAALASTWLVLAVVMYGARESYPVSGILVIRGITPLNYALSQPGAILHYLKLCFWPSDLCLFSRWPIAHGFWEIVPPTLAVGALVAGTVWCVFRWPALGFLGGWFFLILAPTSSVVPIVDVAFDHRMYLPLAAVVVLVTVAAYHVWRRAAGAFDPARLRRGEVPRPWLASACVLVVLALLGYGTLLRNQDYRSALAIWQDTVRKAPWNPEARVALAESFYKLHRPVEAIEAYNRAIELRPDFAKAFHNRGVAYQRLRNFDQAVVDMSKAIELDPELFAAYYNRSLVYDRLARHDLAMQDMTNLIRRATAPGLSQSQADQEFLATCYLRRFNGYKRNHQYREAKSDLDQAVKFDPRNAAALNERAWLLATCPDASMRNGPEAVSDATRAAELTGWEKPEVLDTLAAAYAEQGDFGTAVNWASKAVELAGDKPFAHTAKERLEQYRAGSAYREEREEPDDVEPSNAKEEGAGADTRSRAGATSAFQASKLARKQPVARC